MSLLDDYGMDNWYDFESLNQEVSNNIESINSMELIYHPQKLENKNYLSWSVESAFLVWILIVNYLHIYNFWIQRRQLRIRAAI